MNFFFNRILFVVCITIWSGIAEVVLAQVNVGVNPPGIPWSQINSEDYQIIFPDGRRQDANRVANLLDQILQNDSLTLSYPKIKVPIILQNQTVIPNGFVTIGPWRSEYYLNPPQFQFAGITPWIDMLTIHEYRHVQQVANARTGTAGKFLRVLFGQGGWAFNNRAIMPRWFLEGDAVYAETVYSKGGRGRSPDFEKDYRALRLTGLKYDYEKASFRSFKDYIPSHYNLGYHMTTYGRRKFGTDVWDRILQETYSKPGLYRFSKAVREATGYSTKELYGESMSDLDRWWKQQDEQINAIQNTLLTEETPKKYTNYRFPQYLTNDRVVVHKTSLDEIATIYELLDGQEIKLFSPGISLNEHLSLGGSKLAWSEVRFHPRWLGETYSIIRLYDFNTGKLHKISGERKLMAPGLSTDGKQLAAVEVTAQGKVSLVILDSANGQELHRWETREGEFVSFPRWSDDNSRVLVSGRNLQGNFLRIYHLATDSWQELISDSEYTIDRIFPKGKYVFFSSSMSGVQNIFAFDISTTELFQITSSRFGAFDPAISPDGEKLVYSDYTAMGFRTKEVYLRDALWKQPVTRDNLGANYFGPLMDQEVGDITERTPTSAPSIGSYKYFTSGLFNVHSWYPYVTTEEFGFGVLSKNIMNTLAITGQFTYNTNESSWKTLLRSSYGAFFPILDMEVSTGVRQSAYMISGGDTLSLYVGKWREHTLAAGLRVPLNITHGNYPSGITLGSRYKHYIVDYLDGITEGARDENFGSVDLDFSFQRAQIRATQNIYPRWAQSLSVNYQKTLGDSQNQGEIMTVNSSLFFPGIVRNHSLFVTGGYQTEEIINAYRFDDTFTNARGYGSTPFERIYRISLNYTLPLWYPDISVGSLAFFKRLRGNLFYDYSEGQLLSVDTELRSYGAELVTDFRLVRLVDVGAGVRVGRKVDVSDNFVEFFITSIGF